MDLPIFAHGDGWGGVGGGWFLMGAVSMTLATFAHVAVAFLVASRLTPAAGRLALRLGALDRPDPRKVHLVARPRLGGLAVAGAWFATVLMFAGPDPGPLGAPLLVGAAIVLGLGVWDDCRGADARVKFTWQILAGLVVLVGQPGLGILSGFAVEGGAAALVDVVVGVFFVCLVTNAWNLIDGLDGLAAGSGVTAAAALAALALAVGDGRTATLLVLLAGALLAFLQYNRHPASIFLGDSGSLFIGFVLSVLSLRLVNLWAASDPLVALAPLAALGPPLLDTTLAVVRRWWRSVPLFSPDREHLHHRAMAALGTHRRAVNALLLVGLFLAGVVATVAAHHEGLGGGGILALYGLCLLVACVMVHALGYRGRLARPALRRAGFRVVGAALGQSERPVVVSGGR